MLHANFRSEIASGPKRHLANLPKRMDKETSCTLAGSDAIFYLANVCIAWSAEALASAPKKSSTQLQEKTNDRHKLDASASQDTKP